MVDIPPLQWHRRQAITLASQLPDDPADAIMVVDALRELVESFLLNAPCRAPGATVLPFEGKGSRPAS